VRVGVDLAIEEEQSSLVSSRDGGPMARRTFDVIDVTEILAHWHAGRSKSEIAGSLGVDRKTIRKYVAPAVAAGLVPGGAAAGRGGVGGRGGRVVPGAGRCAAAAGDLAGD
jgi:hypothetical protein